MCLAVVLSTSGCFGSGAINSSSSDPTTSSFVTSPSPKESNSLEKSLLAYVGLCYEPDSLLDVEADSQLIDLGLLAPSDVELSMRELGMSLRLSAKWAQQDVIDYGPIPDAELISDFNSKGEEILKLRLALLRGEKVTIDDQVTQVKELFARGKKVCEWNDENS
jgi:hypothetical protein